MGRRKAKSNGRNIVDVNKGCLETKNIINIECEKLFHICSDPLYTNNLWKNYLETSRILKKIRSLENDTIQYSERYDMIQKFVIWLKQNGAKIDGVSIAYFPDYDLGLRADIDFAENDLLLEIPRKLIFNVHTAASELKDMQSDILIQHMPQVSLAIALLIEKNKEYSQWKPYLDILPKKYCTVLYMDEDDMMELKGSPSLESALKQCRNIARQYAYFKKFFQNNQNSVSKLLKDHFTYEEYRWAVSTVMTRQNIIPSEDNSEVFHSLIPMWDMCNHENGKITTNFIQQSDSCKCSAMRKFNSGDQIFIHYGPRSNTEFFVHSGFVYPNNENDGFILHLGISKVDPLYKERIKLLSRIGLPPVTEFLLKPGPQLMSGLLLGFLRIFRMNPNDIAYWLKINDSENIINRNYNLNEALDINVLKFITIRLKLLLSNYPTSEQDDIKIIQTATCCRELVIRMRLSEKKILQRIITDLEQLL